MEATMVNYNPISKLWQCRIGYIDVLVNPNGMLLTSDSEPALFVYDENTKTAEQVTAVTDDNGNTSYYYVNNEGEPDLSRQCVDDPKLYYLYLSEDPGSSDDVISLRAEYIRILITMTKATRYSSLYVP